MQKSLEMHWLILLISFQKDNTLKFPYKLHFEFFLCEDLLIWHKHFFATANLPAEQGIFAQANYK